MEKQSPQLVVVRRDPTRFEKLNVKAGLLRLSDAATFLSVSTKTVRELIKARRLKLVTVNDGSPWLISLRELDRFIEAESHWL
jgi:excisionase family DNA binding protein